ncbi:alanine racemase [Lachnospiraceae bacterium MD329]|nr:alanine racemase [Lachnospiraceae bacterium MD329]
MDKRTWAEVNLDAIAHNIKEIRKITAPGAQIMAVVKADAYGHGFLEVTKTLLENGADRLAVAVLQEGKQLRSRGVTVPILILGASGEETAEEIINFDITPSVFTYDFAKALSYEAEKKEKVTKIHIKIDTGMSRIGFLAGENNEEIVEEILKISRLPYIEIEGIFSHFATSDEYDREYTLLQYSRFTDVCDMLEDRGLRIPIKHICNSAGIMMYPEMHLDMVRPGVILYGMYPSDDVDKGRLDLIPAMTLKSTITHVKDVEAGRGVSYGKEYITDRKIKIATVPIGYADGYLRRLAKNGKMIVNGTKVPILGRICMDQCMIDVTNVHNIDKGDEVIIFGREGVTVDDLAKWLETINYEVSCVIGKRIPRIYTKNGEAVKILNYLM